MSKLTEITLKELPEILQIFDKSKKSVFIEGTFGIGKSQSIEQYAIAKAKRLNRSYLNWMDASTEEKEDALTNPEKYSVFVDTRLAQFDASDLRGIPIINQQKEYLVTTPLSWVIYLTKCDAAGVLFFDEINLCAPLVMSSAFQIINDRVVADRKLANDVMICAAGNTIEDNPDVYEMPAPLRDRFAEAKIIFDKDTWLEYAAGKINGLIYSFCSWQKSMILQNNADKDKSVTPRGIFRVSESIKDLDLNTRLARKIIEMCLGKGWTAQFYAFLKHFNELDWNDLLQNPEKANKLSIDKKYAVIGGIVEKIFDVINKFGTKNVKQLSVKSNLGKILYDYSNLLISFDTEFFVLGKTQLAANNDVNSFWVLCIMNNPDFVDLKNKVKCHLSKIKI